MPVYVQWKWMERTKSFLVIFHFYDDYSNPNLRTKKRVVARDFHNRHSRLVVTCSTPVSSRLQGMIDLSGESLGKKAIVTWAPSHPELGYLAEVLRYANLVGGLREEEKRDLRFDLELVVGTNDSKFAIDENRIRDIDSRFAVRSKMVFLDEDTPGKMALCLELCPEYIDYLRRLLKPYLRD